MSTDSIAAGNARLRRELNRHSLHEYIAKELMLEIASLRCLPQAQLSVSVALMQLRLYRRDHYTLSVLEEYCSRALKAVDARSDARRNLDDFITSYRDSLSADSAASADAQDVSTRGRPTPQADFEQADAARRDQILRHIGDVEQSPRPSAAARSSGRKTLRSLTPRGDDDDEAPTTAADDSPASARRSQSSDVNVPLPPTTKGRRR